VILNLVDRRGGGPARAGLAEAGIDSDLLERLAARVGPRDWAVDLVLVDDERMAGLNEGFRGNQGVTDVLSFSYLVPAGDRRPDLPHGRFFAAADLCLDGVEAADGLADGGAPVVGEVVIAPVFVGDRCGENGWSLDLELPLLVVHGLLHILGWDHDDPAEGRAMRDHEEKILAGENLAHPLRRRS